MKRKAEVAMYALFFLGALPFAWMSAHEFFVFVSNPGWLESRETHREAALVTSLIPFVMATVLPAFLISAYLLIFGGNATRGGIVLLAATYVGAFGFRPDFARDVLAGLAWDALMMAVIASIPLLLLAIRVRRRTRPDSGPRCVDGSKMTHYG